MLHKSRHSNFPQVHPASVGASAGRVVPGIVRVGQPWHDPRTSYLRTNRLPWHPAGEALSAGRVVPGIMRTPAPGLDPRERHYLQTVRIAPFHTGLSLPAPVIPLLPPRVAHPVDPLRRRGQIFTYRPPFFHTGAAPAAPNPVANLCIRVAAPAHERPAFARSVLGRTHQTGLSFAMVPQLLRVRMVQFQESHQLRSGVPYRKFLMRWPTRDLNYYGGKGESWYRVANDALAGYLLYRGDGELPDFDTVWESVASLPHTTADTLPAGHEWHLVLRQRNKYGLISENIRSTVIDTDATGNRRYRPSAPQSVTLTAASGGTVRLRGYNFYHLDGTHAADTWLIYLRDDGNDPDTDNDTPTEVAMAKADGVAKLNWTTDAYAAGVTIKVTLRVQNSETGAESDNTDIVSAVTSTTGPSAPGAGAFLDTLAEQV